MDLTMDHEFDKINRVLEDFYFGRLKDRSILLKRWLAFLDKLKVASEAADEEDKQHYQKRLSELSAKLAQGLKVITEKSGISESDLRDMVDNPNNFDTDMWNELGELKGKLETRMNALLPLYTGEGRGAPFKPKKSLPRKEEDATPKKPKPSLSERRRKRRSGWISSY